MSKVKKIPTSKLVFETVFPGHVEVKSRIGAEEELFLRLTKEFKLSPDLAREFVSEEQEKISARGDDLGSYFFDADRTLDSSLIALYSGADHIGRVVSTVKSLNAFTFSEYTCFQAVTNVLWDNYRKRIAAFDKIIKREGLNVDRVLTSDALFSEKEAIIGEVEGKKDDLVQRRNKEQELIGIYNMLCKLCLEKATNCLGTDDTDVKAVLRVFREMVRVYYTPKKSLLRSELKSYLDIENDYYQHDIDLLNQVGITGYSFSKKR